MTDGRKTIQLVLAVVGALLIMGCPPPPPDDPDPTVSCEATCAHWEELGCAEAEPTPGGATCTEVCENVMHSGGLMYWNLDCRSVVSDCAEIDDCEP